MKQKNRYDQILEAATRTLRGIEKHNDLERFIESEGLHLRYVDFLPDDVQAAFYESLIVVKKNSSPLIERLYILHELGHFFLHSMCIGYYQTDMIRVIKQEKEAEIFATLVLFPSLEKIETEKDFIMKSGLPEQTAKLRINFFRKTGI